MFFDKTTDGELEAEFLPLMRDRARAVRAVDLANTLGVVADQRLDLVDARFAAVRRELEQRYAAAASADPEQLYPVPAALESAPLTLEGG